MSSDTRWSGRCLLCNEEFTDGDMARTHIFTRHEVEMNAPMRRDLISAEDGPDYYRNRFRWSIAGQAVLESESSGGRLAHEPMRIP